MPHGMCFAWQRNVLLLHVVSDALIALAYFSIPPALIFFASKRRDLPFKWLFAMFGAFIIACGTTHLLAIWTIWHPDYWIDGTVKAGTAAISIATAVALLRLVPKALALRGPRELESVNARLALASAEMQTTIDGLGDGIIFFDEKLRVLRTNRMADELLRLREEHETVVDAEGLPFPRERWPAVTALDTGEAQSNVLMGFGESESRRWLAVSATPLSTGAPGSRVDRVVVSVRDITAMKTRETEQRDYARRLHALHLIASMTTTSRLAQIEAALLVGLEPLGLGRAFFCKIDIATNELVTECSVAADGECTADLPVDGRYPLRDTHIGRAIANDDVLTILDLETHCTAQGVSNYAHGGSYIAVPITIDGSPYGAIGFMGRSMRTQPFTSENIEFVKLTGQLIASSIQRSIQSERLDALAFFDALTGLPNRVLLYDRLVQTILASQRRSERFAVLFLDLDGFKDVNDRYGHSAGDSVLKVVAARLQEALRESDTVARLGGDEFVIIATGVATVADAAIFAERILQTARTPIDDGERVHHLTASIGIGFYPEDGTEMNTLLERADIALYAAKRAGKDRIQFARAESPGSKGGRRPTDADRQLVNGAAKRLARRRTGGLPARAAAAAIAP